MRVEYINPFVEAASNVLKEYLGGADVKRGELYLKSTSMQIMGVAALVGLAGDVEGRVLLDMSKETALSVSNVMMSQIDESHQEMKVIDEMVKATINELANQITAQAVTKLEALGYKFDLTPPVIFTGENMEISNNLKVEALIVPLILGAAGKLGKIEINVVIREKI
jgi:chemotaxis protein CheX